VKEKLLTLITASLIVAVVTLFAEDSTSAAEPPVTATTVSASDAKPAAQATAEPQTTSTNAPTPDIKPAPAPPVAAANASASNTKPAVEPQAITASAPAPATKEVTPEPKTAGITIDTVVEAVEAAGLADVKSIEIDDGQWQVKTQNGKMESKYVLQDSKLSQIGLKEENDMQPTGDLASLQAAIKAAQSKSYTVKGIDFEGNCWQVKAFDANAQEYEVTVNKDGKIINSTMDD
jgi:hypothetical protein